jgi:ubiquinol-cytochrome c reductase cytochrome c1 subunit
VIEMKKLLTLLVASCVFATASSMSFAAGGHGAVLDKVPLNMNDKESLQRGAKLFVNYCLSCHSAQYSRYERVANDLDIPLALLKENLMFTTEKPGDLMKTTMPADDAKRWFGVAPPDLSLVSRVRKPNWVYTYLRAFYLDESSPSGWNNSLFENVAMPHALFELQGVQRLVGKVTPDELHALDAHAADSDSHADDYTVVGDAKFELVHEGKLNPEEFDQAMIDLTSFLVYLAEPVQLKRQKIGVFTLAFLIILMGLCYLLKKEYWRDVH